MEDEDGDGIISYAEEARARARAGPVGVVYGGISAGYAHSLAITSQQLIVSFGLGTDGQLGHGDRRTEAEPKVVLVLSTEDKRVVGCSAGGEPTG